MLEITHDAATLLGEIRREQDVPESYGLRVFAEGAQAGEVTIGLGFTDEPAADDQVSEQEGMLVYVAQELAAPLEDAAIDVGEQDGESHLFFRPKGEAPTAS